MGVDLNEFLNMLDKPVLLVDHDLRVLTANWKAGQVTGKKNEEMIGYPGGEVFECEYARQSEGCGKTEHCSACVIRNSVNETFQTGEPVQRRPATLHKGDPGHSAPVDLLISAKKSHDIVLLMLEPGNGTDPVSS